MAIRVSGLALLFSITESGPLDIMEEIVSVFPPSCKVAADPGTKPMELIG